MEANIEQSKLITVYLIWRASLHLLLNGLSSSNVSRQLARPVQQFAPNYQHRITGYGKNTSAIATIILLCPDNADMKGHQVYLGVLEKNLGRVL